MKLFLCGGVSGEIAKLATLKFGEVIEKGITTIGNSSYRIYQNGKYETINVDSENIDL